MADIVNASAEASTELARQMAAGRSNGCVGTRLLSQTDRLRVWTIVLKPGERIDFHTHVLDYFWTATTAGRGRGSYGNGEERTVDYAAGDIQHLTYATGESMMHDLTNIGNTKLVFITVEFLDSANPPMPLPDAVIAGAHNPSA